MARIQRFSSRVDAELAASMLTAMGIDARVVNDDSGGMHPNLAFGHGGSEIVVPDDQLEEATALLDDRPVDGHGRVATAPPDDGTPLLTVRQLWRRASAVLLVVLLVLVVVSSELEIRWF